MSTTVYGARATGKSGVSAGVIEILRQESAIKLARSTQTDRISMDRQLPDMARSAAMAMKADQEKRLIPSCDSYIANLLHYSKIYTAFEISSRKKMLTPTAGSLSPVVLSL